MKGGEGIGKLQWKRVVLLLSAAFLAVFLSSCQEIDPRTVYNQAQKKTNALSSGEQQIHLAFVIEPEGENTCYSWDMTARFFTLEKESQLEVQSKNSFPDKEFYSRSVYADGTFYVDDDGTQYQAPMEYAMMQERITRIYPDISFSVSQLKNLEVEDKEDGKYFSFQVSAKNVAQLTDFVMNQIQNFSSNIPTDIITKTASGEIIVDEKSYLSSLELTVPCVVIRDGQEKEAQLEYSQKLVEPGKKVTIDLEGLSEYPEVSMWDLPW